MRLQQMLENNVDTLHQMRDDVCNQMIEANGPTFYKLKTQLEMIEEAIFLKESKDGEEEEIY